MTKNNKKVNTIFMEVNMGLLKGSPINVFRIEYR